LDSTTSRSSDGYAKKTVKPGLPKAGKENGDQQGHQGQTLKRVAQPDQIKVHWPPGNACAVVGCSKKENRMKSFCVNQPVVRGWVG